MVHFFVSSLPKITETGEFLEYISTLNGEKSQKTKKPPQICQYPSKKSADFETKEHNGMGWNNRNPPWSLVENDTLLNSSGPYR